MNTAKGGKELRKEGKKEIRKELRKDEEVGENT